MDTTKIRAFLLIEKYKSFSRVAKEFSYTPSALSHMADSLENELGVKLFHRSHNGVELTEAGHRLHKKFTAVINAEDALLAAAAEVAKGQEGTLRIGAYSSIARHILPEILRSFKSEHPTVMTSVTVDDAMSELLDNDSLDVLFTDEHHIDSTTQWYPLMEDAYAVAAPEGCFPGKDSVTREELYAFSFIRIDEEMLDDYLDYGKFREIIQVRSIENETALSMVKEGIGVTVLPELTLKACPAGVRVLQLQPRIFRQIGVQYKNSKNALITERFVKHLKKGFGSK